MRTQYIADGVLVRPLESSATNFLGSRYYDGRGIVDLLESPDTASAWMRTLAKEIQYPADCFTPTEGQLERLRKLRTAIESVYRSSLDGDFTRAAEQLQAVLEDATIHPTAMGSAECLLVDWAGNGGNPCDQLVAELATSAATTVTGYNATLLRKCEAPRCVLYFTRHNSRQQWCSDVCGNRARVARSSTSGRRHRT